MSYSFGKIETTSIFYTSGIQFGTEEFNNSDLAGLSFNLGAMYKTKVSKKYDFFGSLAYTPQSNLRLNNERIIASIEYTETFTPGMVKQLDTQASTVTLKMPSKLSVGLGFGEERKWLIGTEVTMQQSSGFGNRFNDITNATFENAIKYSFGGYYIPNYSAFSNYFKKITYRAGFRYENTGMVISNEKIKDYAVTAGFGFPLGGLFSNLNAGAEFGRRGTAKANLVEENYTNVIISISLNDQWFVKRMYD